MFAGDYWSVYRQLCVCMYVCMCLCIFGRERKREGERGGGEGRREGEGKRGGTETDLMLTATSKVTGVLFAVFVSIGYWLWWCRSHHIYHNTIPQCLYQASSLCKALREVCTYHWNILSLVPFVSPY